MGCCVGIESLRCLGLSGVQWPRAQIPGFTRSGSTMLGGFRKRALNFELEGLCYSPDFTRW